MNNSAYTPNTGVSAPIDPGWNDPPKFSYNAQTTPNKPRNILNKRVAFPMSSTTSSPAPMVPGNLPPTPLIFSPPPPVQICLTTQPEDETNVDSESILQEVKEILLELLDTSPELGNKANDIKRRIDVMETMWLDGKLNNRIFVQMKNLAHALKDDSPSKADDIHRSLMVDHVSAVGTWMPGIKQLIHHCVARTELLSIEKDDNN